MLSDAMALMKDHGFSGIPVVTGATKGVPGRLVGILTNRDVRFATDPRQKISELMTHENLVTVREGVSQDEAKRMLHKHRIEKLLVVDDQYRCVGFDHRERHGKGGGASPGLQGWARPLAGRRGDYRRRGRLRADRAADRRRGRPDRGGHRPRSFLAGAGGRQPHQAALQCRAGHRRQYRDPRGRAGADRCRS